jgi:EmrB/QacA subfamily drug resistance transporter
MALTRRLGSQPVLEGPDRGVVLVLLAGTFVAVLDFFIVNVAIPSIQHDLRAGSAAVEFIVTGFALAYGCGLIIGGRLGDIVGRRRMYLVGVAAFTLSSAACGIAPNPAVLIAARVGQGLSAALLSPQVLTILGATYTGEARARAFNAYGVTMGLAAVFGQVIGGLLIAGDVFGAGWRNCFLINVPIGVAILALTPRLVPESRAPQRPSLDIVGMLLIGLAMFALVLPLVEGRRQGWPMWAWLCLITAAGLFVLFGAYQRRVSRSGGHALVDPGLFREPAFRVGLIAQVVFYMGMAAYFLMFALYVQFGRGLGPLDAGLIFVATGAGYLVTSTTARHLANRMGRQVIALGGILRILGVGSLIWIVSGTGVGGSVGWLVPALVIDGAGMGLAVAPLASTILSRITPQHAGAASGVLTAGIQIGNTLGVAVLGVVFYDVLGQSPGPQAYAHALTVGLFPILGIGLLLATLVQLLPRTSRQG